LTVFGASGLVIGPILAAMFLAVWDMFAQEHHDDSAAEATAEPMNIDEVSEA
jgi:predicted PurR-regulated permease PerM